MPSNLHYSEDLMDRARGTLLASASADALGAPYEFHPPLGEREVARFWSHRGFGAGEWTDDTSQAIGIALAASSEALNSASGLALVAENFRNWLKQDGKGLGSQTKWVFQRTKSWLAQDLIEASKYRLQVDPMSAGNGSLMRTGPVALAFLDDYESLGPTARCISEITHADQTCMEACELWSKAIWHAVVNDNLDGLQIAIGELPSDRQSYWAQLKHQAESQDPWDFPNNGWVIHAFQAAWSAVSKTHTGSPSDLETGIRFALRCGLDTDTVGAIAGALLGAKWGASAVPEAWKAQIYGWPNFRSADLAALADAVIKR